MLINPTIVLFTSLIVIIIFISLLIFLFLKSKTIYEKIQIMNTFNSLATVFIAIYCYYINKPEYIDIALAYAVLSFVSILGLKKYFELNNKKQQMK
jgi:multicomponent Na+:H+ antiporter subunit F